MSIRIVAFALMLRIQNAVKFTTLLDVLFSEKIYIFFLQILDRKLRYTYLNKYKNRIRYKIVVIYYLSI